jgi:hypothetical protein
MDLQKFKDDINVWFRASIKKYLVHAKETYVSALSKDTNNQLLATNEYGDGLSAVPLRDVVFYKNEAWHGYESQKDFYEIWGWGQTGNLIKGNGQLVEINIAEIYPDFDGNAWNLMYVNATIGTVKSLSSRKTIPASVNFVNCDGGKLYFFVWANADIDSTESMYNCGLYFNASFKRK